MNNIHYVNNTGLDLINFFGAFSSAYSTGVLPDELADLFIISFVDGENADGSRRMVINAA